METTTTTAAVQSVIWSLTPIQGVILFVAGLVLGGILYALWIRKRQANTPAHLMAEKKLREYQQAVHQHLMHTTEQVQQLGSDYQRLTEHLQHVIHELAVPTEEGHPVVPHFPQTGVHHSSREEKSDVMPKTYVDRKK